MTKAMVTITKLFSPPVTHYSAHHITTTTTVYIHFIEICDSQPSTKPTYR